MSFTAHQPRLIDPMCGTPVEPGSPYRYAHGGMLFCFCSAACRARFMVNPLRYAVIAASEGAGMKWPASGATGASAVQAAERSAARAPAGAASQAGPRVVIAVPLAGELARSEARGPFLLLQAWRERRFAAAHCRTLMKLHRSVAATHPQLSGPGLYRKVLAARGGSDPAAVDEVLRNAEQSFAIWPVTRALTFRDVVHYLVVSEFVSSHDGTPWVHVNMKRVVESMVPDRL